MLRLWASAAPLLAVACGGLSACGASHEDVIAQVGPVAITKQPLVERQEWLSSEAGAPRATVKQRALEDLISSAWLIAEADRLHLLSSHEVKERVAEAKALGATGHTEGDMAREAEATLAAANIRHSIAAHAAPVTEAQITAYYRLHRREFFVPELRYFDIDNLHSNTDALKVRRKVESGESFAKIALHEERSDVPRSQQDAIERAIFAARPHVLTGPILLKVIFHSLFEVTRIVPASYRPLADVRSAISARLAAAQQQRTLTAFIKAWRARWTAMTDCRPGFVVQKCRQFKGPKEPESSTALQ